MQNGSLSSDFQTLIKLLLPLKFLYELLMSLRIYSKNLRERNWFLRTRSL